MKKAKETEIRQIIKNKDDEIRKLKHQFVKEKEDSVKKALEQQKRALLEEKNSTENTLIKKLQHNVKLLMESKSHLEKKIDALFESDQEKSVELRQLHKEYQNEVESIKRESHKELAMELHRLRLAEERIEANELELARRELENGKLAKDKSELEKQLNHLKVSELDKESPLNTSTPMSGSYRKLTHIGLPEDEITAHLHQVVNIMNYSIFIYIILINIIFIIMIFQSIVAYYLVCSSQRYE